LRGVNYSQILFRIKHRIEHRIKRKTEYDINKMQEKQLIHFLHIGKTGGTAIKYALEHYPASGPCEIYLRGHDIRLSDIFRGEGMV
jgi:hypothetical protein